MMMHENNMKYHRCQLITSLFFFFPLVIKFSLGSEENLLEITSVLEYSNRIEIETFHKMTNSVTNRMVVFISM